VQVASSMHNFETLNNLAEDFGGRFDIENLIGLPSLIVKKISPIAILANEIFEVFILFEADKFHDMSTLDIQHDILFFF
jgi:hypothetical protein